MGNYRPVNLHYLISLNCPIALNWYLHQPESHQLSLNKPLEWTRLETPGPIDQTPDSPGSDKDGYKSVQKVEPQIETHCMID